MGKTDVVERIGDIFLRVPFDKFALVTLCLPSISLFYCFITGIVFRFDEVNETVCKVQNVIPSISAVTGITPQSYVWRLGMALQSTPRLAVGVMHYNYYCSRLHHIRSNLQGLFKKLIRLNFWLYITDNCCLIGVTYISNKDNYPVHEKIFIVFMVTSLCYMLLNTIVYRWSRSHHMSTT
ncbi:hypothetical protein ScPMuIL_010985, partial [Solemya velum]